MSHENMGQKVAFITKENDNLRIKPRPERVEHASLVTGDIHGNALKLLHFLCKSNVIAINDTDYQRFYNLYHQKQATKQQVADIKRLIDGLIISDKSTFIRLLGDELCDRGNNDFFTLRHAQIR